MFQALPSAEERADSAKEPLWTGGADAQRVLGIQVQDGAGLCEGEVYPRDRSPL